MNRSRGIKEARRPSRERWLRKSEGNFLILFSSKNLKRYVLIPNPLLELQPLHNQIFIAALSLLR